ncbi:antirestriction protein ArdA [Asticcacaulis benevestitus]|uniref:Antirestriction protein ArdA n=1 Tax=Asticcacaulis benevestitus DSM 16100 = ATCC BAA-896 TaxID=1121022 RepID=V4P4I4_9CAUL|nr:antirestriction protein ArdA [Asticcacaulis benevestitus]ESQ83006.1 hypothetical protein ABENE_20575 [Asticcacaulis benevestitus DSM 16100 = ATCC BAA-896]
MTSLYAQPFDISATGFYFDSYAAYQDGAAKAVNSYGQPVEEFEIQFIDGEGIDCQLFAVLRVHQGEIADFFDAVAEWSREDKIKVIIAVGEAGHRFDIGRNHPDKLDVDLYDYESMSELAAHFVDEGLFGEIPAALQNYIDIDAIAYDLAMDYGQVTVDGTNYIYRCG